MDPELSKLIDDEMPKFTREIAEGYAVSCMSKNEAYINELWQQVAKNFPPNIQYISPPRRLSPLEEYRVVTSSRRGGTRNIYDVAKSDVTMIQFRFLVDGQELTHNMYAPYVGPGGSITIKNAKFTISPVIADVALSVRGDSIFVIMNRAKLTFKKFMGYILVDGERESSYIVWSQVYNIKTRKILSTIGHYLFCKFGVTEAFRRMGVDLHVIPLDEVSSERYPVNDWVTITSVGKKLGPRTRAMLGVNIALMIPRHQYNHATKSLAASFFYVADQFPERVTINDYQSTNIWRILLGKAIFPPGDSDGKILNQINTHMASVDGYVDGLVREWLHDGGYPNIYDIYDLFQLIIKQYPDAVAQTSDSVASLYGKRLVINRYVNENIINGISSVLFAIQKHMNSKGEVKLKDMQSFLTRNLKYNLAFKINSGHSEVKSVSSASDCMIHKITSVALMQTETTSSSTGVIFDESKQAHQSILEVGGVMNLPSGDPSGRSRLNMTAKIDASGTILADPQHREILDEVHRKVKR